MTDVLVGCPITRREWIADRWLHAAADSVRAGGATPSFLAVIDPSDPTVRVLERSAEEAGVLLEIVEIDEPRDTLKRDWHPERYDRMAELRNLLLAAVRAREPDLFWSLDSDILVTVDAYTVAERILQDDPEAVASSTCCFLTPGERAPNYANLVSGTGQLYRKYNPGLTVHVDVIMAMKLMAPAAYHVDYAGHRSGEDIGWSLNVRAAGGRLRWASEPISKHVMEPRLIDQVDKRCGY